MSNVSMDATFDGTVFRRRSPSGEKSWRLHPDGTWAVCLDHKGPWVSVPVNEVPRDIIEHLIDFRATMLGTTVEQEREFFAAHPNGLNPNKGKAMTNLTPLVEDAARAVHDTDFIEEFRTADHYESDPFYRDTYTKYARAALLAFHNPDSEAGKALVEVMARAGYEWLCADHPDDPRLNENDPRHWEGWAAEGIARAALTAIATALKETALELRRDHLEDGVAKPAADAEE